MVVPQRQPKTHNRGESKKEKALFFPHALWVGYGLLKRKKSMMMVLSTSHCVSIRVKLRSIWKIFRFGWKTCCFVDARGDDDDGDGSGVKEKKKEKILKVWFKAFTYSYFI